MGVITGWEGHRYRSELDMMRRNLRNAVRAGMRPFKPGQIHVFLSDNFIGDRFVRIEMQNLPNNPIIIKIDRLDLDSYPEDVTLRVMNEAYDYAFRLRLPREEHLILGSE